MINRRFIELAIEEGRDLQSGQTKFVHYNYHADEGAHYDTIPTLENFLFVLALLKSRKSESIQEAKEILGRLLCYQTKLGEGKGNFPIYLHEFPTCYSRWQCVKLLAPMYWVMKNFHHILGDDLRKEMRDSLENMVIYCLKAAKGNPVDYLTSLRIGSGAHSIGKVLGNDEFVNQGSQILDDIKQLDSQLPWFSRRGIAEMLTSLNMVYPNISESPWEMFWSHLESTWHPTLHTYCGPAFDERQKRTTPEPSLYDYYMSFYTEEFSDRLCEKNLYHLHAALIHPSEDRLKSNEVKKSSGTFGETEWRMQSTQKFSYSLVNQRTNENMQVQKGFHPFYLQWEHNNKLYSLVCAGGRIKKLSFSAKGNEIDLFFTLSEEVTGDHFLENRELLFYCTAHDELKRSVEGVPATTFNLGDTVHLNAGIDIALKFELVEGQGDFLGHLMLGNRPSQRLLSKRNPCKAYDWQIFLRTIRKKSPCTIHVTVKMAV